MNKPVYKRSLLTLLVLLAPSLASAVGMGKLTVLSVLGQPLNAEIELVSLQQEELPTLSVQLASMEAYRSSDRQYNAVLAGLRLQLQKRPDGQSYIKLSSERTVNDPFVDLLIELKWASGRLVREYSALIDPRDYAPAQALVSAAAPLTQTRTLASAQPPVATPVAVATTTATVSVAPPPPATPTASVEYGPIKRGETLSKIAFKLKPQSVSLQQMMVGIFRTNPDAFINNNMNRLKADQILNIPELERLIAILQSDALKEVRLQLANLSRSGRSVTATVGTASSRHKVSSKDKPVVRKPVLRLSSGDAIWPRQGAQ